MPQLHGPLRKISCDVCSTFSGANCLKVAPSTLSRHVLRSHFTLYSQKTEKVCSENETVRGLRPWSI